MSFPSSSVEQHLGTGGFPYLSIHNRHARANICLYGGQIMQFQPHGCNTDVLFVSGKAFYEQGQSIKGGAPLCWPWFGVDTSPLQRSSHGFARTQLWTLVSAVDDELGNTVVTLALPASPAYAEEYGFTAAFDLTCTFTVGRALEIALTTRNLSPQTLTFSQAIHTYFAVGDVRRIRIHGLDKVDYIDHAQGAAKARKTQHEVVTISAETDRVYQDSPSHLTLVDDSLGRQIDIYAQGSRATVVWNPWVALAQASLDLSDDDYLRFVCIETANTGVDTVTLRPQQAHTLVAHYDVAPVSPLST